MLITSPPAPPQTDAHGGRLHAVMTTIKIRLLLQNAKFNSLYVGITQGDFAVVILNIPRLHTWIDNCIEMYVAPNTPRSHLTKVNNHACHFA